MDSPVNLFGAGYLGSEFARQNPGTIINDKHDLIPKSNEILYTISTITNYHVHVNPFLDIETNLTTLIRVLENYRAKYNDKGVFNFVSSWFVYGKVPCPVTEESHCDPKGFYGITKRTAEQMLISYCETFNMRYRIFRMANIIGGYDPKASAKKNALTWMIGKIKRGEDVELYDGGLLIRDYIHVSDAARAIQILMSSGPENEIYNVGNNIPVTLLPLIEHAIKCSGSRSNIIVIPQREFHKKVQAKDMYMDSTKLRDLGYQPSVTAFEMVEGLIDDPRI